jgi:phage/plasmid-associated DNA primase
MLSVTSQKIKSDSLIVEAGDRAFRLKSSKEFGWQVTKPYETNSYKESAFKYCRSRLERPEPLPSTSHLQAFKNCVVDLRTGARMSHSKEHYLTNHIPYNYAPGAQCPEDFRKFIADSLMKIYLM